MNNYKGLFTFDVDNHRYVPVEQADGLISDMNYYPEENEEQKSYWVVDYITCGVDNLAIDTKEPEMDDFNKQIGNYFDTREEAEKAVEKLQAWKRLKDKGFKITLHGYKGNAWLEANWGNLQGDYSDIIFLFGGEEFFGGEE